MIFTLTSLMVTYTLLVYNGDKTFSGICNIPQLDPWDASIMKYLPSKSAKLPCPEALNILYLNDSGFILYNESALQYYSLNSKHLGCTYQTVVRSLGDTDVKFGPRKELKLPTFVNSNVSRVSCSTDKKLVYDLLHLNPFWVENQERDNEIGLGRWRSLQCPADWDWLRFSITCPQESPEVLQIPHWDPWSLWLQRLHESWIEHIS